MNEATKQLILALEDWLKFVLQEKLKAVEEKLNQEQPKPPSPKSSAARSAKTQEPKSAVSVKSRAELSKVLLGQPVNQSADDEDQTNDYQILWGRFKTAPFTPKQAMTAFKSRADKQMTESQVVRILVTLEREALTRELPNGEWIMEKVYGNQR